MRQGRTPVPIEQRFWQHVEKTEGCWLWTGHTSPNGLGYCSVNRIKTLAAEVAWMLERGAPPAGKFFHRQCAEPRCVRPDHYTLGDKRLTRGKKPTPDDLRARIAHNTRPEGECLVWIGKQRTDSGYGRMGHKGGRLVHRLAWELERGPIPDGMEVCHHCDNPPCVRLDHLFLGTHLDNMQDMHAKGRGPDLRGEKCPSSVLTDEQIREIRARYDGRHGSQTALARQFGVTQAQIHNIVRHKQWTHVD